MLEVKNLQKSYGKKKVLHSIDLELSKGEAIGLLGPNGAGKTTCFYIISGLISPDKGKIKIDKSDYTSQPMHKRAKAGIGYLPQESSIFRGLTVEQNIKLVLENSEKDISKRNERLDELLAEFSITHLRHSPALALSGGERRRAEIARALASNPKYILLDEPLAGIDPVAVEEVRNLISQLKDKGIGVLITDHNVRETLGIVDRAYIIYEGKVITSGSPDDIVKDKKTRQIYLGENFSM